MRKPTKPNPQRPTPSTSLPVPRRVPDPLKGKVEDLEKEVAELKARIEALESNLVLPDA